MERVTFKVEFVTPCFPGGADNTEVAEWRAASIRGQLRWWFRAIAGGFYKGNLPEVRNAEAFLFGSTEQASAVRIRDVRGPKGVRDSTEPCNYGNPGMTAAQIAEAWGEARVIPTENRIRIPGNNGEIRQNPIKYLGYGAVGNQFNRARLDLNANRNAIFTVQFQRAIPDELGKLLTKSVWSWINLSGIGSKSRKGYGSFRCMEVESDSGYFEPDDYDYADIAVFGHKLQSLLDDVRGYNGTPEWSHFSEKTKIYASVQPVDSWVDALELVGAWLIAFRRRYGVAKDTRIYGGTALADRDYDWARNTMANIPDRVGFGLPLPFARNKIVSWGALDKDNRRASPLHIHVLKLGRGGQEKHHVLMTYFPARFLPNGEEIYFKKPRQGADPPQRLSRTFSPSVRNCQIVQDFLSDLSNKNLAKELI